MQYQLIGQIFEVIPKEFRDKKTGEVSKSFVEVTVEQVTTDANGFRVKDIEKINFDEKHYQELKSAIDKYIVVPFEHRQWRDANTKQMQSAMMMSEGATYQIYDKDPLAQTKPAAAKSAA
jgi:hypothetical protein